MFPKTIRFVNGIIPSITKGKAGLFLYFRSLFILSIILLGTGCSKDEHEIMPERIMHTITYTACGKNTFTFRYYDGVEKTLDVTGCCRISVPLAEGDTASLSCYSGENETFVMAILQDDTTRCHFQCGPDQLISLAWKIGDKTSH